MSEEVNISALFTPGAYKIITHFVAAVHNTTGKKYFANATTIAKEVGTSHVTASKHLKQLHAIGILNVYLFGVNHIYELNKESELTKAILELLEVAKESKIEHVELM